MTPKNKIPIKITDIAEDKLNLSLVKINDMEESYLDIFMSEADVLILFAYINRSKLLSLSFVLFSVDKVRALFNEEHLIDFCEACKLLQIRPIIVYENEARYIY